VKGGSASAATSYDSDAAAYFARMPTQPGDDWKAAANDLVTGLKADGLFAQVTALYLFSVDALDQELPNVLGASYGMTRHGTVALTARSGIASDGTSGYYDTGFSLTSALQTAFSHGAYIVAQSDGNSSIGVSSNGNILTCIPKGANGGTDALLRTAMTNQANWANAVGEAHFALTRNGSSLAGYQDGVVKFSGAATTMSADGSTILWMRRQSTFSTARLGAGWIATAVLSGLDIANLHGHLSGFFAAIA